MRVYKPMEWTWVYKIAADIPNSPGPKTVRTYYDFFKSLMTVLPNREERITYRKIVKEGPFKLASSTLASGPEKTLEWIVDVRNGILLTLGKEPKEDHQEIWKLLKFSRSTRDHSNNNINDENLDVKTITSVKDLDNFSKNGRLCVVMFDNPHLLFPRARNKNAAMDLAQLKARFDIDAAIVPGKLSYRWYFAKPFTEGWKYRVTKYPWFRIYKNGKVLAESKDATDIKRYLKQRAMKDAPIVWTSINNNRKPPNSSTRQLGGHFANGFARGAGQVAGRAAGKVLVPPIIRPLF